MGDQLRFHPSNLTRSQFERLTESGIRAESMTPRELLDAAKAHLEHARTAHAKNRVVNFRLASAIVGVFEILAKEWEAMPANQTWWMRGAMHYFATSNDDEPDFRSPIGFEDDLEILNACLKFAGRDQWCLKVEDYDNA